MNDSDIESMIREEEQAFAKDLDRYESGEYDELTEVMRCPNRASVKLGLGYLVLGNSERSSEWLRNAPSGYLWKFDKKWTHRLESGDALSVAAWRRLQMAVFTALASRHEATISKTLNEAVTYLRETPEEAFQRGQYEATCALVAVAAELDDASNWMEKLQRYAAEAEGKKARYMNSSVLVFEGVLAADSEQVAEGVREAIAYHREVRMNPQDAFSTPWTNSDVEKRVCLDACVYTVLAQRHGLDVRVNDELVPDTLYEWGG